MPFVAFFLLQLCHQALAQKENAVTAQEASFIVSQGESPIAKVIKMLQTMQDKGKKEKVEEMEQFAKFHANCDATRKSKTESIEEGKRKIQSLEADAQKAKTDAKQLGDEIDDLTTEIERETQELKVATENHDNATNDYKAQHKDFTESIDAVGEALKIISKNAKDIKQSLIQVKDFNLPMPAQALVQSFLAMEEDGTDLGAPKADAYKFKGGKIVDMLKDLLAKFKDKRHDLEQEFMKSGTTYEKLKARLEDSKSNNEKASKKKKAEKGDREEDEAAAISDLNAAKRDLKADEDALDESEKGCVTESDEYERNQNVRAGEIKAIEAAIDIMGGDNVKGVEKPKSSAMLLIQLSSSMKDDPQVRRNVVEMLQKNAKRLNSRMLSLAASFASKDHFVEVKKEIKNIIVKLVEGATEELKKKEYCASEVAVNSQTRKDKTEEVEGLTVDADELAAKASKLAGEIKDLAGNLADIQTQQKEATELRGESKATNTKAINEAKEAQTAIQTAIKVLKDFYGTAAKNGALLQAYEADGVKLKDEMEGTIEANDRKAYQGQQGSSGEVVQLMESILNDFARIETETTSAEDVAAEEYKKLMDKTTEDLDVKKTSLDYKEEQRTRAEEKERDLRKDIDLTKKELKSALNYYEKLKKECLDFHSDYEGKKLSREEEIESLQEAMAILSE